MTNDNLLPDVTVAATRELVSRTYEDLVGPAFKTLGQACEGIAYHLTKRFQNMYWEKKEHQAYMARRLKALEGRLADIPLDELLDAPPLIAGPIMEGGRWVEDEPDLMSMFDDLLASSMDPATATSVHPAFTRIIKELTPDEAKIIRLFRDQKVFAAIRIVARPGEEPRSIILVEHVSRMPFLAGCEHPGNMPTYTKNLERLGLIEIGYGDIGYQPISVAGIERYKRLLNIPFVMNIFARMQEENPGLEITRQEGYINATPLGKEFTKVCVRNPSLPTAEAEGEQG